jgi:two-component system OmpR family response regulator
MSVTALSARAGRHTSFPAGPGRAPAVRRTNAIPASGLPSGPSLTVTLAIPLGGDTLSPEAYRLIDVLKELVEQGNGTVTMAPGAGEAVRDVTVPRPRTAEPSLTNHDDGLVVDPAEVRLLAASRQVVVGGTPLPMTRLEFDLLHFLAVNPRRVFSRMQLLAAVWGYEHTGERTVDVHVRRLRVKLGAHVPLVTTVYGVGYRLADDATIVVSTDE